ncbi:probable cytochrome P450 6a23 isoform X2 [Atheta coriaria]
MLLLLLIFLLTLVVLVVTYFRQKFTYWKSKNILTLPYPSIPWGHINNPLSSTTTNMGIHLMEVYQYIKFYKEIHGGIYMASTPVYVPVNLELIKCILIKDFNHFDEKGMYYHEEAQPISAHMFQIGGEKWRRIRQKVSPTFTSGKLKGMFPIVHNCVKPMLEFVATQDVFDIKRVSADFTIDVIGNCAFGLEINSFKNEHSEFYKFGKKIFMTDTFRAFSRLCTMFFPNICHALNIVNHYKDVEAFFTEIVTETVKLREEGKVPKREDFINLLIELKREDKGITIQDIITQSFLFFAAGFETSSSAISHLLFETAQQPAIQHKIKKEIEEVLNKHNGQLTYEGIHEMTYLSQVMEETLRKYPSVTVMHRECSRDYQVPGTNLTLEKGTLVFIPTLAIHWDDDIYPRPHVFDPERFSAEKKKEREVCSWLGFGEGPRQCIGLRFAHLQTKIALVSLFKEYNFNLHESSRQPLTFSKAHILSSKGSIMLEKQKWSDTNLENFLKEDRQILKERGMKMDDILKLLQSGKIPLDSSHMELLYNKVSEEMKK